MPIDLAEPANETAQMEQMRQEQPVTPEPVTEKLTPEPAAEAPTEAAAEPAKAEPAKDTPKKGEGHDVPLPELRKSTLKPEAPEAPKSVDHTEDPLAAIGELRDWKAQREKEDQDRQRMSQFQQTVVEREAEFVKENPDYPKAIEFLKEARVREMRDGLGLNDQQISQALAQEAAQTAMYAMQNDLNPAEVFMRLAKVRGFAAEAPAAEAVAEPAPVMVDPAALAKLKTLGKGLQAGKSVSNAGGGAALPTPSLEAIANLDGADFDAAWKSGKVKALMN